MKDIEIEIQVKIENSKKLKKFLEKNASFQGETHQIDEYFSPSDENFIETRPVKKWLRLRKSNKCNFITFKNYYYDEKGKSIYCDEYETEIKDTKKIKSIFQALNYNSLIVVNKKRKVWNYKDYEIVFDSVKNLGDFIEIEYKGKKEVDPKKMNNKMIDFLKSFDCGKIKRNHVGYPFLLLFPGESELEEI